PYHRLYHGFRDFLSIRSCTYHLFLLPGLGHELEHAEHVAVIGDGHRRLPVISGLLKQTRNGGRAVEKRKLCVVVEVRKFHDKRSKSIRLQNNEKRYSVPGGFFHKTYLVLAYHAVGKGKGMHVNFRQLYPT